ncbi:hypothetical protein B0H14DRAFT_3525783 [Mycena olivaceomarginata]|nr:hypothetical protein B0H14DRAFT_3525783 [Mycena olivaceomarginata]
MFLKEWSEHVNYFIPTTLCEMGLHVAFGHARGICPHPHPERLEAITVRGIKTVTADYFMCAGTASDDDQIKAHGWWPYGSNFVSVMTLDVLRIFVVPEAEESEAGDSGEPDESESDEESDSGTESSTSE